jgi:fructose-bisphosphate aldolase class 1
MRVIAEIPHADFKVSILNMNNKFIIKIEQGALEQIYKIPDMDLTDGVNSVFELLDEDFYKTVGARFADMRKDFKDAYYRYNY